MEILGKQRKGMKTVCKVTDRNEGDKKRRKRRDEKRKKGK